MSPLVFKLENEHVGIRRVAGFFSKGLNSAPKTQQFSTKPAVTSIAPCQPNVVTIHSVMGASRKVPMPDPHTAIPVAKARFFSK